MPAGFVAVWIALRRFVRDNRDVICCVDARSASAYDVVAISEALISKPRWPALFGLLLALSGCAHVPAYERERLAQRSMSTEDVARASEDHVRAVHEGAIGGGNSSGGGCGCN